MSYYRHVMHMNFRIIADFFYSVNEIFALLRCFAVVIGSYLHFRATCQSHLQGSICPEMSVTNYQWCVPFQKSKNLISCVLFSF